MAKFTSSADLSVRLFALGEKSLRKTKPSPEHSFGWPSFLLDAQTQGLRDYLVDKVLLFTERFPSQLTPCITCTEQDKTLVLPVALLPMSCCVGAVSLGWWQQTLGASQALVHERGHGVGLGMR